MSEKGKHEGRREASSMEDLLERKLEESVAFAEQRHMQSRKYYACSAVAVIVAGLLSLGVAGFSVKSPLRSPDAIHAVSRHIHNASSSFGRYNASSASQHIASYKNGEALILNLHITHHAGTTMCSEMKKWGPTPDFACNGGDNWNRTIFGNPRDRPWTYNGTAKQVDLLLQRYHMISWEFGPLRPGRPLDGVNWELSSLVSIYVSRNPLDRLLSGGGSVVQKYGKPENRSKGQWEAFAKSKYTNNFALNVLTSGECVQEERTTAACLERAKALLERFTVIIDQACLNEGIMEMAALLGKPNPESVRGHKPKSAKRTPRERIAYDVVYESLKERNAMDIALYEWSKSRSIVHCESLDA